MGDKFNEGTMRDYFAAQALTGIISTAASPCIVPHQLQGADVLMAETAYKIADAMLAERDKSK